MRDDQAVGQAALESRLTLRTLQDLINGIRPEGRWSLGPGNLLRYRGADAARGKELRLSFTPITAHAGSLVVALTQQEAAGRRVTRLGRLDGRWALDSRNRLTFEIESSDGPSRRLVFGGAWTLDERQRIAYSLESRPLRRRTRFDHALVFEGDWDLGADRHLVYRIEGRPDRSLVLRGAFQTGSILAKQGVLRYQAGVEVSGTKRSRTIKLFGRWIVSRDFSLSFEVKGAGPRRSIVFGGKAKLGSKGRIEVELTGRTGRPLGVEVILTRDVFTNGTLFARWVSSLEESRAELGVRSTW